MKIQFELTKHEIHRINEVLSTELIHEIEMVRSCETLRLKKEGILYIIEWEYVQEEDLVIINTVFKYI